MSIRQQIGTQNASLPITLSDCKTIDFHFNKGHLEFTDLPMWIIKAKGRTFYISHFTSDAPFSTRETPEGSTKGMLRFRECSLMIDASGSAHIADARALQIAA